MPRKRARPWYSRKRARPWYYDVTKKDRWSFRWILQVSNSRRFYVCIFSFFRYDDEGICWNTFAQKCFLLGFYPWRNTTDGSWFIQALCDVLSERGKEEDLLSIMTTVSRIVAIRFESNTPQDSNMQQRKQIPCVTSLLTRKVFFNNCWEWST